MATVYSDRGLGVRGPVVFYNRCNEAAARLKPGDFDWKAIFGAGVRWFHSGGIFAALSETTAELIADGVHVDEIAMKVLVQSKGAEKVILISDGTSATGMPDGKYMLGGLEVTVIGGVCRNAEGRLAGSTLTLDRALRNIVRIGTRLADAVRMLTLNPATLLGIEFKKGALRTGADADIVLLTEGLEIAKVFARGTALQ
jgi:N-acetylglucosamine-6-phosphate deacetylase